MSVIKSIYFITLFAILALSEKTAESNGAIISKAIGELPQSTPATVAAAVAAAVTNGTTISTSEVFNQTNNSGSISNETSKTEEFHRNLTNSTGFKNIFKDNNGAMLRAFYVIVGVTAIVIVYFVVRSVRLRRKRSKTRKYGISGKSLDLEMTPLDQEDDDDDLTVYEAPKSNKR